MSLNLKWKKIQQDSIIFFALFECKMKSEKICAFSNRNFIHKINYKGKRNPFCFKYLLEEIVFFFIL